MTSTSRVEILNDINITGGNAGSDAQHKLKHWVTSTSPVETLGDIDITGGNTG